MDSMQEWEVAELYGAIEYADYHTWEQTRLLLSCHVDHKKVKKLTDIMKFPWDKEVTQTNNIEISKQDISRLGMLAEKLSQNKFIMKNDGK